MKEGASRSELAQMIERLLAALERHAEDYHYQPPPELIPEARALLQSWQGRTRGRRRLEVGRVT